MEIEARIVTLVRPFVGRESISLATRLWQDLHIGGDDADELMTAFAEQFEVDMAGFDPMRFFPDETQAMGETWAGRFGLKNGRPTMTIGHLVEVGRRRQWFDPT